MTSDSQIIAELRAEITELKRRVSALEEKFNHKEEVQIQVITEHLCIINYSLRLNMFAFLIVENTTITIVYSKNMAAYLL